MFIEIDEKVLKRIEDVTITNYENKGNLVPASSIEAMLEDLLVEIGHLEEVIEDMEEENE